MGHAIKGMKAQANHNPSKLPKPHESHMAKIQGKTEVHNPSYQQADLQNTVSTAPSHMGLPNDPTLPQPRCVSSKLQLTFEILGSPERLNVKMLQMY